MSPVLRPGKIIKSSTLCVETNHESLSHVDNSKEMFVQNSVTVSEKETSTPRIEIVEEIKKETKKEEEVSFPKETSKDVIISEALQKLLDRKIDNTIASAEASLVAITVPEIVTVGNEISASGVVSSGEQQKDETTSLSKNQNMSPLPSSVSSPILSAQDTTNVIISKETETAVQPVLGQEIRIPTQSIPTVASTEVHTNISKETAIAMDIHQNTPNLSPSITQTTPTPTPQPVVAPVTQVSVPVPTVQVVVPPVNNQPSPRHRGITAFFDSLFGDTSKVPPVA